MPPRVPYLYKRTYRNGTISWQYVRWVNGERIRKSLGDSYTAAAMEARRLNATYDGIMADPKQEPAPAETFTVDDLFMKWLSTYAAGRRGDKGRDLAHQRYHDFVHPVLGDRPARTIDENDMDELGKFLAQPHEIVGKRRRRKTVLSPQSRRHVFADVRCMFRFGHRRGLVGKFLDFADVMPQRPQTRPRALSHEDVARILATAPIEVKRWIRLALLTGMRWSEQKRLAWPSVNLENREITIERSKNRRSRTIPLPDEAVRLLTEMREIKKSILVMEFEPEWSDWMVKQNRAESGVHWHWHQLRHTFATRFLNAKGDVAVLSKILGHRDITTTMIYVDVWHDAIAAEAARVNLVTEIPSATQSATREATQAG